MTRWETRSERRTSLPGRTLLFWAVLLLPVTVSASEPWEPYLTVGHTAFLQERFQGDTDCGCFVGDIQVDRVYAVLRVVCPTEDSSGTAGRRRLEVEMRLRPDAGEPGPDRTRNFLIRFVAPDGFGDDRDPVIGCLRHWFIGRDGPLPETLRPARPKHPSEEEPKEGRLPSPSPHLREDDVASLWQTREHPGPVRMAILGCAFGFLLLVRLFWIQPWRERYGAPRWGLFLVALGGFLLRLLLPERLGDVRPVFLSSVGPEPGFFHRSSVMAAFQWILSAALADWWDLPRWEVMVLGNRILGAWGTWNVGMLTFALFGQKRLAILSAMVVALFPPHLWASVTSSDVPLVFLLLSHGFADLVYAVRWRHFISGVLGFGSLAMAVEVRVEALAYVLGIVFLVWSTFRLPFREPRLRRLLLLGLVLTSPWMLPGLEKLWNVLHGTDLASVERFREPMAFLGGWWRLAFATPFVCVLWTLLFGYGLWRGAKDHRLPPWGVVLAMALSTVGIVSGFMPAADMITDHRYYVPLLVFAAPVTALGLDDLGSRLFPRSHDPVTRLLFLGALLLGIHLPTYPRLSAVTLETREFLFLREHLRLIPDGSIVAIARPAPVADGLEPGDWISWLERRRVRWIRISPSDGEEIFRQNAPVFWYHGGQCRAIPSSEDVPAEPCQVIEQRFRMEPMSLSVVRGNSLAGARYGSSLVPVGLFRVTSWEDTRRPEEGSRTARPTEAE